MAHDVNKINLVILLSTEKENENVGGKRSVV